jgi:hypothetical protein
MLPGSSWTLRFSALQSFAAKKRKLIKQLDVDFTDGGVQLEQFDRGMILELTISLDPESERPADGQ